MWHATVRVETLSPDGEVTAYGTGLLLQCTHRVLLLEGMSDELVKDAEQGRPILGVLTNWHVAHFDYEDYDKRGGTSAQNGDIMSMKLDVNYEVGAKNHVQVFAAGM